MKGSAGQGLRGWTEDENPGAMRRRVWVEPTGEWGLQTEKVLGKGYMIESG